MHVLRAAEGETVARGGDAIFEGGSVWARPLAEASTSVEFRSSLVQFAAGARTRWHTHSGEQLLYVTAGIGEVGTREQSYRVSAGDFIVVPAGEEHWHGAGDTGSPMSHISTLSAAGETMVLD